MKSVLSYLSNIIISITFLLACTSSFAQTTHYIGQVTEANTGNPLPFASVVLHSNSTGLVITGAKTDIEGNFKFHSDSSNVFVAISASGFQKKEFYDFVIANDTVDFLIIQLNSLTLDIEEVQVTAERSTMEFKLDKRVFNVGKDISSTGMGALEVLNNVPSVSVDIEGNIKLRGNTGVQILINGKPSVLSDEASNALGTITADMIESIEVITNPSAKYDASGTSGIINIILKKEENKGMNGSISVNTGWPHNHSIGGSINYRATKFNLFTQFGAGYRSMPRYERSENNNLLSGSMIKSDGISYRNENFYNLTLGSDFYINDYNTLTLSGNVAYEIEDQPSSNQIDFYDSTQTLVNSYNRIEETSALNPKYQYDLQYHKVFKNNKEHELQFSTIGSFFGKDQSSEFRNDYTLGTANFSNQETKTNFFQSNQTYKLDYVNPFTKRITFETGAMYEVSKVGNDFEVYNEDMNVFILDTNLTNDFNYDQNVLGVYVTGSYEGEKWGVKGGLRAENTDLETYLVTTDERNARNFTNFFPTLHTSYKVSRAVQLQAGYSRRIFRPRLWDLNPFFNIRNNYNIHTGNPDLLPEFADSYELTGIFIFKKVTLNSSLYYLHATEVKENIATYSNNITLTKPMNIGTNDKIGVELNWKYSATRWLTINGDFNYGYFDRRGEYLAQNFNFNGDQWSGKTMLKLKFKYGIDIELTGNYQSGYKTIQGSVADYAFGDLGIRKKIWKGKAVINLAVRDIFATRIHQSYVDQPTYSLYNYSTRGRFITLGFSYSFGKGEAMTYSGGGRH